MQPGSWAPLAISVSDRAGSAGVEATGTTVAAKLVVTVRSSLVPGGACYADGPTTFTCAGETGGYSTGYTTGGGSLASIAGQGPTVVSYISPLLLTPGATKTLTQYVLAQGAVNTVSVEVVGEAGHGAGSAGRALLAAAQATIETSAGQSGADILVVTGDTSAVQALAAAGAPTGSLADFQYLAPGELPPTATPLGAFRAVVIDEASTSSLSPAQAGALEDYVQAGGTLVVAGGLSWEEGVSGLPAGLLPASASGMVGSSALPALGKMLGMPPLRGPVDLVALRAAPGAETLLSEGTEPLVVSVGHGLGHVVACAFDPAAQPLEGWPGAAALLELVFSPAFAPGFDGMALPYEEGGGVYPVQAGALPRQLVARLGAGTGPGVPVLGTERAGSLVAGYFGHLGDPALPPSPIVLGLALLVYVVAVFVVLRSTLSRPRRRRAAWVAVLPCLAGGVAMLAALTVSTAPWPLLEEAQIAVLAPGSSVGEVSDVGVVQLPSGGEEKVTLGGLPGAQAGLADPLPGQEGGGDGGTATFDIAPGGEPGGAGDQPDAAVLTVWGPRASAPAWAVPGVARLAGRVGAEAELSGGAIEGTVTNQLGVRLEDTYVVAGSGAAAVPVGKLGPGISHTFELAVQPYDQPLPQAFGAAFQAPGPGRASKPAKTGEAAKAAKTGETGETGATGETGGAGESGSLAELVEQLGATYSAQQGGLPVLVAVAKGHLLPPGTRSTVRQAALLELVVVPVPLEGGGQGADRDVPSQLVASSGVTGEATPALGTGSLTLGAGGAFYYEFPTGKEGYRGRLELDLGGAGGWVDGPMVTVSAYDWRREDWALLGVTRAQGEEVAPVPRSLLDMGHALEVRLEAAHGSVEVYGAYPQLLSVAPARAAQRAAERAGQAGTERSSRPGGGG